MEWGVGRAGWRGRSRPTWPPFTHPSLWVDGRGQPYTAYCRLLSGLSGRELEMRDAALAALRTPLWTVAQDQEDIEFVIGAAK